MHGQKAWWALVALAAAALVLAVVPWDWEERVVLAILAATMVLWIAEVLPLGVTAMASTVALITVAGRQPAAAFASYFDPVVALLLGGFLLGVALRRLGLDHALAGFVLDRVGTRPATVLLAVMATTLVLSMWVSNTATTAILLPIALTLAAGGPPSRGRAFVLGVAAAANIGGIGTPIGTPANAIALRFLQESGHDFGFLDWMLWTVPVAVALALVAWAILRWIHPLGPDPIERITTPARFSPAQWRLMAVFFAAVLGWLTTDWHGLDPAVVAVAAAVALFALRILDERDLSSVSWDTLLLIGGSIALGEAVQASGLDDRIASFLDQAGTHGPLLALTALVALALLLTLVTSNTAAAVLLIPLTLVWASAWGLPATTLAVVAACAVSCDFLVPMGTPPNAMARATGLVNVTGMLRSGVPLTLAALVVLVAAAHWLW